MLSAKRPDARSSVAMGVLMTHPRTLVLTPVQRAELERVRARDNRPYLREMASALLQIADGASARAVALSGLLRVRKPETVAHWVDRYRAGGVAGLVHRPRRRRGLSPPGRGGAA